MNNLLSFVAVLQTVGYALCAILILLLMITVHELGHYLVGKIFKFKINDAITFLAKLSFSDIDKKLTFILLFINTPFKS